MTEESGHFSTAPVLDYLGVPCGRCAKGIFCRHHGTGRDWCELCGHLFEEVEGEFICVRESCGVAWVENPAGEALNRVFDRPSNRW